MTAARLLVLGTLVIALPARPIGVCGSAGMLGNCVMMPVLILARVPMAGARAIPLLAYGGGKELAA